MLNGDYHSVPGIKTQIRGISAVTTMPLDIPRGFTGERHPEVFNIPPPQPEAKKPGQLTPEQLQHFFEKVHSLVFLWCV